MSDKKGKREGVSNVIHGLEPVDPAVLEDFLREMNDKVIPDIVDVVEERRLQVAESRQWQLKC